jgi:hypothetical protein
MGDWCEPTLRHQLIENRGASITVNQESRIPRGLKKGIRKILTGTSVPLDTCLLMGDPMPERGTATFAGMTGIGRLHINVQ